jgi:hypothetical protein
MVIGMLSAEEQKLLRKYYCSFYRTDLTGLPGDSHKKNRKTLERKNSQTTLQPLPLPHELPAGGKPFQVVWCAAHF